MFSKTFLSIILHLRIPSHSALIPKPDQSIDFHPKCSPRPSFSLTSAPSRSLSQSPKQQPPLPWTFQAIPFQLLVSNHNSPKSRPLNPSSPGHQPSLPPSNQSTSPPSQQLSPTQPTNRSTAILSPQLQNGSRLSLGV